MTYGDRIRQKNPQADFRVNKKYPILDLYYLAITHFQITPSDVPETLDDGTPCRAYIDYLISQDYVKRMAQRMDPEKAIGLETSDYSRFEGVGQLTDDNAPDDKICYYDSVLKEAMRILIERGVLDMAKVVITEENKDKLTDLYAFALQDGKREMQHIPKELQEEVKDRMKNPQKHAMFKLKK